VESKVKAPSSTLYIILTTSRQFELLIKSNAMFDLLFVNVQCATACSVEKLNFIL